MIVRPDADGAVVAEADDCSAVHVETGLDPVGLRTALAATGSACACPSRGSSRACPAPGTTTRRRGAVPVAAMIGARVRPR